MVHGNGVHCLQTSSLIEDSDPNKYSKTFSIIENLDIDPSRVLCDDHVFADNVQGTSSNESSALLGANSLHLDKGVSKNEIIDYPELETLTDIGLLDPHERESNL